MIKIIIDFFHSETFLIAYYGLFFIDGFLMIFVGFLIGRHSYIKKMDMVFLGYSPDYGIIFNSYRAFTYGMSMLFPGTLGKRVHKNVDISKINRKDQWPYIFYISLFLFLGHYMIVFSFFKPVTE